MSTARRPPHSPTWLRTLVLLLALLLPGAPVQAHEAPVAAAGEIAGYDVLDAALRPPARAADRPAVPLRPAPRQEMAPGAGGDRPVPALPRPPLVLPTLAALRSVVLRC
ncbi:hypothetical protein OHT57_24275 [Streptomyces sp. NBC_00285]|uniref:hypothetical protein n=1 Tax=Streptomyces sp. NBC_00285 TaxID=2975700 RepID=UPI002E2E7667|nr:hypothetical protein [Streptomyces sp. NBC_00285]